MKKLIIIPAYNESECIERTIKDIEKHAQGFDYLIVNDSEVGSVMVAPVINLISPVK